MDASQRGKLLFKLAALVEKNIEELSKLESIDNGKTVADSEFDINCAIDTFRYYAGWCDKVQGNTIPAGIQIEKLQYNCNTNMNTININI